MVRGTKDVDIVVAPDAEEIRGHVPAGESFLSSQLSIAGQLASGEQVAIETDLGRLDIVQGLDGIPTSRTWRTSMPRANSSTLSLRPR